MPTPFTAANARQNWLPLDDGQMQNRPFASREQLGLAAVRQSRRAGMLRNPRVARLFERRLPAMGVARAPKDAQQIAVVEFSDVELFGPAAVLFGQNCCHEARPRAALIGRDQQCRLNQLAKFCSRFPAGWRHSRRQDDPIVAKHA